MAQDFIAETPFGCFSMVGQHPIAQYFHAQRPAVPAPAIDPSDPSRGSQMKEAAASARGSSPRTRSVLGGSPRHTAAMAQSGSEGPTLDSWPETPFTAAQLTIPEVQWRNGGGLGCHGRDDVASSRERSGKVGKYCACGSRVTNAKPRKR